jgi:hypothetical protein
MISPTRRSIRSRPTPGVPTTLTPAIGNRPHHPITVASNSGLPTVVTSVAIRSAADGRSQSCSVGAVGERRACLSWLAVPQSDGAGGVSGGSASGCRLRRGFARSGPSQHNRRERDRLLATDAAIHVPHAWHPDARSRRLCDVESITDEVADRFAVVTDRTLSRPASVRLLPWFDAGRLRRVPVDVKPDAPRVVVR